VKVFDADKTRIIGLLYGEKNYDNMLSHFHSIQTDRIPISISHVSMLLCDKNPWHFPESCQISWHLQVFHVFQTSGHPVNQMHNWQTRRSTNISCPVPLSSVKLRFIIY